jgi:hypothetical protein
MGITELFFDQAHSPKLVYAFDPGDDVGNTTFRCERMNASAEFWIRENACDGKLGICDNDSEGSGSPCVESVFESWGVLSDYRKVLEDARRRGKPD